MTARKKWNNKLANSKQWFAFLTQKQPNWLFRNEILYDENLKIATRRLFLHEQTNQHDELAANRMWKWTICEWKKGNTKIARRNLEKNLGSCLWWWGKGKKKKEGGGMLQRVGNKMHKFTQLLRNKNRCECPINSLFACCHHQQNHRKQSQTHVPFNFMLN